jgi:hypothetical protein
MYSHLGRPWHEAPLTTAHRIQAVLPTCPLFRGGLARHGDAISGLGSSVKRKENRAGRGQSSHWVLLPGAGGGTGLQWLLSKMSHSLVLVVVVGRTKAAVGRGREKGLGTQGAGHP